MVASDWLIGRSKEEGTTEGKHESQDNGSTENAEREVRKSKLRVDIGQVGEEKQEEKENEELVYCRQELKSGL
jgi:hypothetical protein